METRLASSCSPLGRTLQCLCLLWPPSGFPRDPGRGRDCCLIPPSCPDRSPERLPQSPHLTPKVNPISLHHQQVALTQSLTVARPMGVALFLTVFDWRVSRHWCAPVAPQELGGHSGFSSWDPPAPPCAWLSPVLTWTSGFRYGPNHCLFRMPLFICAPGTVCISQFNAQPLSLFSRIPSSLMGEDLRIFPTDRLRLPGYAAHSLFQRQRTLFKILISL